jgi:hypothetical protein
LRARPLNADSFSRRSGAAHEYNVFANDEPRIFCGPVTLGLHAEGILKPIPVRLAFVLLRAHRAIAVRCVST